MKITHSTLIMSLLSFLLGCTSKKTPPKPAEWPRFPETDHPTVQIRPIPLDDDFELLSFFIAPDKKNVYVLGARSSGEDKVPEGGEPRPGPPDYMDYRLYLLDAKGQVQLHKDMLRTDWMGGGTFGMLESEFLLRVGDWFLVLDPQKLTIQDKIPVHTADYIPWNEPDMTRDEFEEDYQKKFDAVYSNPAGRWLFWPASGEYLVYIPGAKGHRAAWSPVSYEADLLAGLQQHFKPISVSINPLYNPQPVDTTEVVKDDAAQIRAVEYLSGGTQLDYPNYKTRRILQSELILGDQKVHFSTTDRSRHALHPGFSDNLYLNTEDGAAWLTYEGNLYRIQ